MAQANAQDEFASMAGISRSHMGKIERGEHVPTLPLILKISVALKISAAELMAVRIPLMADSDSIPIADSVPGDGGHVARVS